MIDHIKLKFNALADGIKLGAACVMECTDRATGEPVYVVCAVLMDTITGTYDMLPLAKLFNGNPYEEVNPPVEMITEIDPIDPSDLGSKSI